MESIISNRLGYIVSLKILHFYKILTMPKSFCHGNVISDVYDDISFSKVDVP